MSAHPPIPVAVIARSWPPATKWGARVLQPALLMMPAPPLPPRSLMSRSESGVETWFMGVHQLQLHPGDAANLRANLAMSPPSLWVSLSHADDPEKAELHLVTADPFEGEAMATDPGLRVERLPMPDVLIAHISEFAALFPEEERFRKKRRSGIEAEDPSLSAPRILPGGHRPGQRRTEAEVAKLTPAGLPRSQRVQR